MCSTGSSNILVNTLGFQKYHGLPSQANFLGWFSSLPFLFLRLVVQPLSPGQEDNYPFMRIIHDTKTGALHAALLIL